MPGCAPPCCSHGLPLSVDYKGDNQRIREEEELGQSWDSSPPHVLFAQRWKLPASWSCAAPTGALALLPRVQVGLELGIHWAATQGSRLGTGQPHRAASWAPGSHTGQPAGHSYFPSAQGPSVCWIISACCTEATQRQVQVPVTSWGSWLIRAHMSPTPTRTHRACASPTECTVVRPVKPARSSSQAVTSPSVP